MLIYEALGYNRFGLRCVTEEEMEARRKFVLSINFSPTEDNHHKPLESYQDGKKSLRTLVLDRYQDESNRLKKKYQDFFKFPQSREFQSYQQQKQKIEEDYQKQKKWVDLYYSYDKNLSRASLSMTQAAGTGALLTSIGTLAICSNSSLAPATASLCYLGALYQFYGAYRNYAALKKDAPKAKERIKMVLEDWHKPDPLARYDRSCLNDKLQLLDKKKPTQIRQSKKRELVAQYRLKHPKEKSNCR